ncbi:MAG: McrC family protein [Proteobacteria bacterium]|nr:McrC family protein [Pseudomonadota bacterium]
MIRKNIITVFEHESLKVTDERLSQSQLESLQAFYGEKGVPYFSLIHKGIKFNSYVGVIQVGQTTIEILPKADGFSDETHWRDALIGMIKAVGLFKINVPTYSSLKLKPNSILDLYFELFINQVEYLLHTGLVKKYRKVEGNKDSLKGRIKFNTHIPKNIVHKERFYVCHSVYDNHHQLHCILFKAIQLLKRINTNPSLSNRLGTLCLNFPEMPDIKVTESLFSKTHFNKKTEKYRTAIDIAQLLLLNFHPDIKRGQNHVLALMFDMNVLWEKFVYVSLRKHKSPDATIKAQNTKSFWKHENGRRINIRPDIVMDQNTENCVVLDTKWKNLSGSYPSIEDLRQMFVYMKYYDTRRVAVIYPGADYLNVSGCYSKESPTEIGDLNCCLISLPVNPDIKLWQRSIHATVSEWKNSGSLQLAEI